MILRLSALTIAAMTLGGVAITAPNAPTGDVSASAQPAELQDDTKSFLSSIGFDFDEDAQARETADAALAVEIALARGAEIRAAREAKAQSDYWTIGQVSASPKADVATDGDAWRVTGSRVNLRAGPGTGHAVTGQVGEGDLLVPVSATTGDWIEVRRTNGETAWIYARFLAPSAA